MLPAMLKDESAKNNDIVWRSKTLTLQNNGKAENRTE